MRSRIITGVLFDLVNEINEYGKAFPYFRETKQVFKKIINFFKSRSLWSSSITYDDYDFMIKDFNDPF